MANLPEKNITTVSAITSIPSNTNIFVNANGQFGQASIDNVVKASNVVSDATLGAMKEFIDLQFKTLTGSPILAQGTEEGYMPSFKGKGASSQKSYSGYQLLDYDAWSKSSITNGSAIFENNGITLISTNGDCYVNAIIEIPVSEGETINISWEEDTNVQGLIYIFGNGSTEYRANINNANGKQLQYTIPTGVTFVTFRFGVLNSNTTISYKNIMINKGDTVLPYEPFVGAQPSPNPSYTQDIKSKGDMGWFDGELLQGYYKNATGSFILMSHYICNKNPIPCKENDKISLTYEKIFAQGLISFYKEDGTFISDTVHDLVDNITATAPPNAAYCNISINQANVTPSTAKKIVVTINGTYAVKVTSVGKNLFKYPYYETTQTVGGITFTDNGDGSITLNGTATEQADIEIAHTSGSTSIDLVKGVKYTASCEADGYTDGEVYLRVQNIAYLQTTEIKINTDVKSKSFVANYTKYYAWIRVLSGTTVKNLVVKPMLRLTTVKDDTYVLYKKPHEEWIPLSEPLRGIGEVTDEIKPIDGLYRGHRKFKEIVFDGSDDEGFSLTATNDYGISNFTYYLSDNDTAVYPRQIMCNALPMQDKPLSVTTTEGIYNNKTQIVFRISLDRASTVEEFRAWLAENPIKVIYELEKEVIEELDQTPFYRLKTFEGVTHISASDDMEMVVEVPTSRAGGVASIGWSKGNLAQIETQNLSEKIAELQTAMVNM